MKLQVSHSVCTEVQKESILRNRKIRNRRDIKETMRMEGDKHNRSGSKPRLYTYIVGDTIEVQCIRNNGMSEG